MRNIRALFAAAVLSAGGCDNMQHQENVRPFEPSKYRRGDSSARMPPSNTVPWADSGHGASFETGMQSAKWLDHSPVRLTPKIVERGADRYSIFCVECHGADGEGGGIVVLRGFPRPRPFSDLDEEPLGAVYGAISSGKGPMFGYSDRISPEDRWAISGYVRALGLSERASISDVPQAEKERLRAE